MEFKIVLGLLPAPTGTSKNNNASFGKHTHIVHFLLFSLERGGIEHLREDLMAFRDLYTVWDGTNRLPTDPQCHRRKRSLTVGSCWCPVHSIYMYVIRLLRVRGLPEKALRIVERATTINCLLYIVTSFMHGGLYQCLRQMKNRSIPWTSVQIWIPDRGGPGYRAPDDGCGR